nr:1-aminocyclopropane-1-carboxylate oxidase homolog 1-like [Tanacetum cinerariifolium]
MKGCSFNERANKEAALEYDLSQPRSPPTEEGDTGSEYALETCGFFQIANHGIHISMLEEMKKGVKGFFEQDDEVKNQWYTRDSSGKYKLVYNSNFDLYAAPVTNWRDTFYCPMAPNPPQPPELPFVCRDVFIEYSKQAMNLGKLQTSMVYEPTKDLLSKANPAKYKSTTLEEYENHVISKGLDDTSALFHFNI